MKTEKDKLNAILLGLNIAFYGAVAALIVGLFHIIRNGFQMSVVLPLIIAIFVLIISRKDIPKYKIKLNQLNEEKLD